jgi:hypothetical protein
MRPGRRVRKLSVTFPSNSSVTNLLAERIQVFVFAVSAHSILKFYLRATVVFILKTPIALSESQETASLLSANKISQA